MNDSVRMATRLWTLALPRVSAFVGAQVRDFQDRDDILQDTAIAVIESIDRFDLSQNFTSWAIGIARNQVRLHACSAPGLHHRRRISWNFFDRVRSSLASPLNRSNRPISSCYRQVRRILKRPRSACRSRGLRNHSGVFEIGCFFRLSICSVSSLSLAIPIMYQPTISNVRCVGFRPVQITISMHAMIAQYA